MPTLEDKELDAKASTPNKKAVLIASGIAVLVILIVVIVGFATNWKFGNNEPELAPLPAPIPTEAPAPGGITSDDYGVAEPGSGTIGEEVLVNRSSAGWSLDVGVLNLSEEPSDFTVKLLDEEGEELSSKEVELAPSFVENVQIYLPQDYEAGTVTIRLDSPVLGEGLAEAEVVVGE